MVSLILNIYLPESTLSSGLQEGNPSALIIDAMCTVSMAPKQLCYLKLCTSHQVYRHCNKNGFSLWWAMSCFWSSWFLEGNSLSRLSVCQKWKSLEKGPARTSKCINFDAICTTTQLQLHVFSVDTDILVCTSYRPLHKASQVHNSCQKERWKNIHLWELHMHEAHSEALINWHAFEGTDYTLSG